MRTDEPEHTRRWVILAILGTAQLMVVLDATIVNIALPSAQKALHFSDGNRQWIVTAYALAFGSLLLLGGRLSDLFGRRWTLITGLSGFAIASAVGGLAQSFAMLTAARASQGAFAALLAPSALSLLTTTFTEPAGRAKAFGVFSAIAGSGASIGLLLGGILTQLLSWRYSLYVNLVFATVAVTGALAFVPNSRPAERPRLDIPGTLAVSAGLFALAFGFSHAETTSWGSPLTLTMPAGGLLLLAAFVAIEARAEAPLLPLRVVTERNRGASFLSIGISSGALFAVFLFLTYYLQQTRGFSPIATGLAFLPMTVTVMVSAIIGLTKLQGRIGPRPLVVSGMAFGAAGMLALTRIGVDSSYAATVLPAMVVIGIGIGLVISTSISNATFGVDPADAGVGSAAVSASQQIGASLGTALLATLASSAVTHFLAGAGRGPGVAARAAVHGYTVGFAWAAAIFAIGAIAAAALFTRRATGVEMAGQIAEIARDLCRDFRSLHSGEARILLVEAGDRVLSGFPPSLSRSALRSLERLGVTTRLGEAVVDLDEESVTLARADGANERIPARTVVWAAGVLASGLANVLAERAGVAVDRAGRVEVLEDLSLPGHPEVLVIGDMITIRRPDGPPVALPGLAPAAMQEGRHAARAVRQRLRGRPSPRFHYRDKGNLATIGRARAVAEIKVVRLTGFVAWATWLTVHLWYLIGFENRLLVLIRWAFSFATHGRGARLITGTPGAEPRVQERRAVATSASNGHRRLTVEAHR